MCCSVKIGAQTVPYQKQVMSVYIERGNERIYFDACTLHRFKFSISEFYFDAFARHKKQFVNISQQHFTKTSRGRVQSARYKVFGGSPENQYMLQGEYISYLCISSSQYVFYIQYMYGMYKVHRHSIYILWYILYSIKYIDTIYVILSTICLLYIYYM